MSLKAPLELAAEMVAIPSVTHEEAAYVDWLAGTLSGLGFEVARQTVAPDRDNLIATRGEPRVLFCTHTDTVPPFFGPSIDGDRLSGRGACDTKGLTASMLHAAQRLIADGLDDIGFLMVVGEEAGHHGAKATTELDLRPERILLGEPTENKLCLAQKGMWMATLVARGEAAHSGYPELGHSAIHDLLDAVERIRAHPWPTDETLGPTTLNVGTLSGGVALNVMAPEARADLLFRLVGPMRPVAEEVARLVGPVEITRTGGNDPFFYDVPPGYPTTVVAFNTDAPYIDHLGPVTLVGPGTITVAHTAHEYVDRADLEAGVALYERLAREVLRA